MISRTNEFGNEISLGENLSVLRKARDYFAKKHGESIIDYWFCYNNKTMRTADGLDKKLLRKCCISGKDLYHVIVEDEIIKIRQKRHLIFVTVSGKKFYTAYMLEKMLRDLGFVAEEKELDLAPVPDINEFLNFSPKELADEEKVQYFEAARDDYNDKIVPFVLKWRDITVSKDNLIDFLSELEGIKSHLLFYGDGLQLEELSPGQTRFMDYLFKLLRIQ